MARGALRIVLVSPPFRYFPGVKSGWVTYSRPPMGLAYLAAHVRKHLAFPVEISILDCAASSILTDDDLIRVLVAARPDVIGFSVVTATRDRVGEMATSLKAALPEAKIVLGGPHVTALPAEECPGADALFFGEAEESFVEYLDKRVLRGRSEPIDGCIQYRDGSERVSGGKRPLVEPLDRIPIPARDLLPNGKYMHYYPHRYSRYTTMLTSRGCPFDCNFCANRLLWNRCVRHHSLQRVREEIDEIVGRFGVDLVCIEDDTFLANRDMAFQVMRHIRDRHQKLKWVCHTRADMVDEAAVAEMVDSRCVEVQIGVESGVREVLARTDKKLTIEAIRSCFDLFQRTPIKTWATFLIGNEGETPETFRESVRFSMEIAPSYASYIVLLPFPGTRVYESYRAKGYLRFERWSDFSWYARPVFETERLTRDEIERLRRWAYRRFYLRPSKLWGILKDVIRARSLKEILRDFLFWTSVALRR